LDTVVKRLGIKRLAKECDSTDVYNEDLIRIFNGGGMDAVMRHFEKNYSPYLKVISRRKIRELQEQGFL
jgi:hypothetical protein